jgi:hypothetical protein
MASIGDPAPRHLAHHGELMLAGEPSDVIRSYSQFFAIKDDRYTLRTSVRRHLRDLRTRCRRARLHRLSAALQRGGLAVQVLRLGARPKVQSGPGADLAAGGLGRRAALAAWRPGAPAGSSSRTDALLAA